MTILYDRAPIPPRGSILEAAIELFASMRQVRKFQEALAIHGVHATSSIAFESMKKQLKEAFGLDDRLERERHQQEMSQLLNRWSTQAPFTVEKLESIDETRKRLSAAQIQNRRAQAVKDRMRKNGVIPEGWRS